MSKNASIFAPTIQTKLQLIMSSKLLRQKTKSKDSPASIVAKEIEFISSHFYEIDRSEFKKFKIEIIEEVVKNDKLKIENEDSLLKFIIEIYSENPSYLTT